MKRILAVLVVTAAVALGGINPSVARNLQGFPLLATLQVPGEPTAMTVTPSSDALYVVSRGSAGVLSVFTLVTSQLRHEVPLGNVIPRGVVSPPSSEAAFVSMRDLDTGSNKVAVIPLGSQIVAAVADAPNAGQMAVGALGQRIFIADENGSISSFVTSSLQFVGLRSFDEPIGGMVLSADEVEVLVTLPESNRVLILDSASLATRKSLQVRNKPYQIAAAPSKQSFVVSHRGSPFVTLIDYARLRVTKQLRLSGASTSVLHATSQNSYFLAATAGTGSSLNALRQGSPEIVGRNSIGPQPTAIATDPWSTRAFVANASDSSVAVFDLAPPAPGVPVGLQAVGIARGITVSWSPDPSPGTGRATQFTAQVLKTKKVCRTAGTSCTFRGLQPGKRYLISVQGSNIRGEGPVGTVSIVIPRKPPPPAPLPPVVPPAPPKPEPEIS